MQPLYDYFQSSIFKTFSIGASDSMFMSDVQP